ncbi:DUF5677 domain-containing protein [Paenibacillus sp. MMS18-CY102]|uniref:DUF5677 domain-containing protein n=1 Tax=Paenibacillus sp. MMS18-CY102 TaxID=2682849 RepID=UPI00136563E3|nr:DUF5677 domain-containing protein [Paenibacillus sp. MMS18-CY102]MWC28132.1 hypothetical protein [Paenibacillus sp. MMS18-CY102]
MPLIKDEIYERWGKELEISKSLLFAKSAEYHNLILILQTCEIVMSEISSKQAKKYNQLQGISRFLMAHVFQLGVGSYQLTKTGFGSPALILCRSIYESLVDMAYLWLCKEINDGNDIERNAWAAYYKVSRYNVYTHWEAYKKRQLAIGKHVDEIFEEKTVEKLKKDFKNYESDYPYTKEFRNREWNKINSLIKRARKLDDTKKIQNGFPNKGIIGFQDFSFEAEYVTIYKHTSEYAHGESGSLQTLFQIEGNKGAILIGANDSNVSNATGLVTNYLLIFSYMFAHINNIELQFILDELERHKFVIPTKE